MLKAILERTCQTSRDSWEISKKFEPSVPKNKWRVSTKGRDAAQSSQFKGKETMAVELSGKAPPKQKRSSASNNQEFKFLPRQYSFKDKQVETIFHLLNKGNKIKLPEVRWPEEMGRRNDPSYYLFYRMVHHPTSRYFILKDKIQALADTRVLTFKSEQKKVPANMMTLNFETFRRWQSKTNWPQSLKPDWILSTQWWKSRKLRASFRWRQNLERSCGSI